MSETETKSAQGSPFWRFSLQFYRQPAVADACIQLQDEAGVDVNLLFFLLWFATQRRSFSASEVEWLESKVGPWRDATVIPIRNVRRALKVPPAISSCPAVPENQFSVGTLSIWSITSLSTGAVVFSSFRPIFSRADA